MRLEWLVTQMLYFSMMFEKFLTNVSHLESKKIVKKSTLERKTMKCLEHVISKNGVHLCQLRFLSLQAV